VPLVIAHDQMRRIARTTNGTLTLSVDDTGLLVEADLDPADADVAYIAPKLRPA
jgi:phage head maturation protease